jgi:uncharacterized membrane protein
MIGVRECADVNDRSKAGRSQRTWLTVAAVLLLVVGIFFRFVNIDRKVYWVDEVYTALRVSGYTQREYVREIFNGQEVTVADLQHFQHPDPTQGLDDTLDALKGNAEHAPLYFLLLRFWVQTFGTSVATIRTLSALISLFAFPCLYWLCRELFETPAVSWMALSLLAISPLHVLYAQEARQYSLWTVTVLLSSAALLWALRTKKRHSWVIYSITIALGLYTHLLFALTAIAHTFYVFVVEKFRPTRSLLSYVLAAGAGLLAFVPWMIVVATSINQIQTTTQFLTKKQSLSRLIDGWFLDINRVFLDLQLGSFNFILVLLIACALAYLFYKTPRRVWLLVIALIAVNFLSLAIPDAVWGGMRSLQVRYLIPVYLGFQIALAFLFTYQALSIRKWWQKLCRVSLILLVIGSIVACSRSAQAEVWWNKSLPKSYHYPKAAEIINQVDRPLVISDSNPIGILSFSYLLDNDVRLRLVTQPQKLKPFEDDSPTFLLTPSTPMKVRLKRKFNYELIPALKEDGKVFLWRLQKLP